VQNRRVTFLFYLTDDMTEEFSEVLMKKVMGKFVEIKSGLSLRRKQDIYGIDMKPHIEEINLQSNLEDFNKSQLAKVLLSQ
jgi:hypothetical protein